MNATTTTPLAVTREAALRLYAEMVRINSWEQRLMRMMADGQVAPGFYHPGRGHEAVAAGACASLRVDDYIMYDHRGCGQQIAKGLSLTEAFGDLLENVAGSTGGLGAGIIHMASPELGILGQSGTLGAAFPIAAGAALSAKYRGTDQVCVCFFGEGASNRGTFHEAANAASLWDLPVVWLCENNGWAISTSVQKSTALGAISQRAAAYGMPGRVIDGRDVFEVYEAVALAVDDARAGRGPTLIEARLERLRGHFMGDPESYRPKFEGATRDDNDPILRCAIRLLSDYDYTTADLESVQATVDAEVEAAATAALAAELPPLERLFEGLYA
jgi:acetoin:2,6-dichlorophenolindophenol oxidoreductase subunit alpha